MQTLQRIGVYFIIGLQLFILLGMGLKTYYPLWVGREIMLEVEARDPRDIFRGHYVELNYHFNSIRMDSIPNNLGNTTYRFGDVVYLHLKKNPKAPKYYQLVEVCKEIKDDKEIYLKAICQDQFQKPLNTKDWWSKNLSVKAGIESYFTTKQNAQAIDQLMLSPQFVDGKRIPPPISVKIKVAPDGSSRIAEIIYPKSVK